VLVLLAVDLIAALLTRRQLPRNGTLKRCSMTGAGAVEASGGRSALE
jgi:hypothetical protein